MSGRGGVSKTATAGVLAAVVVGMLGMAYAAVPLYQVFCRVTGFGGTTRVAGAAPATVGDRVITVRFNADVASDLPWRFRPVQRELRVRLGEETLAFYTTVNKSDVPLTGRATFNVTPFKAGLYFNKIDCFCFTEQLLAPGESAEMAVSFFIDPELVKDRNLDDLHTVTLSYTFFRGEAQTEKQQVSQGDSGTTRDAGMVN